MTEVCWVIPGGISNGLIQSGYCQCGCGERTSIIPSNDRSRGLVKGQPFRFVVGHNKRAWEINTEGRQCSMCGKFKPWDEFSGIKEKSSNCRDCHHVRHMNYMFGSANVYELLLNLQDGVCFLCRRMERTNPGRRFSVDHSHNCESQHPEKQGCFLCIRGLLCRECNFVVEHVDRSPVIKAQCEYIALYLERRPLKGLVMGNV